MSTPTNSNNPIPISSPLTNLPSTEGAPKTLVPASTIDTSVNATVVPALTGHEPKSPVSKAIPKEQIPAAGPDVINTARQTLAAQTPTITKEASSTKTPKPEANDSGIRSDSPLADLVIMGSPRPPSPQTPTSERPESPQSPSPTPPSPTTASPTAQTTGPALPPAAQAALTKLGWSYVGGDNFKSKNGTLFNISKFIEGMCNKPNGYSQFSGILDDQIPGVNKDVHEILCKTPEDVDALIALATSLGKTELVTKLTTTLEELKNLKDMLYEKYKFGTEQGRTLLEMLSITSTVLDHPSTFGDIMQEVDEWNRSEMMNDLAKFMYENWDKNAQKKDFIPINFPLRWMPTLEGSYQAQGHGLKFNRGEDVKKNTLNDFVALCLKGKTCLGSLGASFFRPLFPQGLHLVESDLDKEGLVDKATKKLVMTPSSYKDRMPKMGPFINARFK